MKRLSLLAPIFAALACAPSVGSSNAPSGARAAALAPPSPSDDATFGCPWTLAQQQLAWAVTSVYENNTTVIQYDYCENIGDGRGYTSGRAGFCSGTGDAIQVVECFAKETATRPGTPTTMERYLPGLRGLEGASTAPVDRLGDYCRDWGKAATDPATAPLFKACQDRVAMALYQRPACASARAWGATSPLFLAEMYDAWVNHGSGDDLLEAAGKKTGIRRAGARLAQADESTLLGAFLALRLEVLRRDKTWAEAVDRLAPYEAARRAGNFDFRAPVDTRAKAAALWPGLGLVDSKAASCTLAIDGEAARATLRVTGEPACTAPSTASAQATTR